MKLSKHVLFVLAILATGFIPAAGTLYGTKQAIRLQQAQVRARAEAALTSEAASLGEQIGRQIKAIDQTLGFLVGQWQRNPRQFDLESLRSQAVVLTGLSRDAILADQNGQIRQCSVPEAIDRSIAASDYFRALSDPAFNDGLYIGPASIDGIMRQWHMNVARALRSPDGVFAGVIVTDYRIAAITEAFSRTGLGASAFLALVGTADGRLRGTLGSTAIDPDLSVADTRMFTALARMGNGIWTGPTATDAVRRIHAFRTIPGRNLALVVALAETEAMTPATSYRRDASAYAACVAILLIALTMTLIIGNRRARRHARQMAADQAVLAAANAQLEVARAEAAAKAERLEALLNGMADGVSMIDAHMCLVEWNPRFPEIAGIPPDILRVGLPMEEILYAQLATGQFGPIADPDAEVQRRMARLRTVPMGVTQRLRPDGRTLELRRNRLPDGGFVTLYADITGHKRTNLAASQIQPGANVAQRSIRPETGANNALWPAPPAPSVQQSEPGAARVAVARGPQAEPAYFSVQPRVPRTRVLLVEDVDDGECVMAGLLRRAGHFVEIVHSGEDAMRALRTRPYDIVLMDIATPAIDNVEAVKIVRTLPEPAGSVPIIGLTANLGGPEPFRQAGMNGAVDKTAAAAEVLEVIVAAISRRRPDGIGTLPVPPVRAEPDVTATLVLSAERIGELRANLPPRAFADLVEECIADLELRLPALRQSVAACAPAAISVHGHTMAGLAADFGMQALEVGLRDLLRTVRDGSTAAIGADVIRGIEDDFARARGALRESASRGLDPHSETPVDP